MNTSPFFIRSLDISQASPFLEKAWEKICLNEPNAHLQILNQPKFTDTLDSTEQLEEIPKLFNSLISWSIPNEKTIEDITRLDNIETTPRPLSAVYKLADKRTTKFLFEKFSIPTPDWEILNRGFTRGSLLDKSLGEMLENRLVRRLGFPLALKPIWNCMGHGINLAYTDLDISKILINDTKQDLIAERYIMGESGSIEIIGIPGKYYFQHPCWTGTAKNGVVSNFDSIRVSHSDLFEHVLDVNIKGKLKKLLEYLDFHGACCVDFVCDEKQIYFLEINPRVSGVSCLSSAATGLNSFEAIYLISSKKWNTKSYSDIKIQNAAIQMGGRNSEKYSKRLMSYAKTIEIFRDNNICVDGHYSRSIIAGGEKNDIYNFLKEIDIDIYRI